ncbi:MAG: hypothetical protein L0H83_11950 [Salinisphaera sp.]|nr:hypothetical protein [Salinisphaera sp.]
MDELSLEQKPEAWSRVAQGYDAVGAPFTARFAADALRLAGVAPIFSELMDSLTRAQRSALSHAFARRLQDQGDGPYALEGEAHIAVGVK